MNTTKNYRIRAIPLQFTENYNAIKLMKTRFWIFLMVSFTALYSSNASAQVTHPSLQNIRSEFSRPSDIARTKLWWFHGETQTTKEGITPLGTKNVGKGKVYWGMPLSDVLIKQGIKPDAGFKSGNTTTDNLYFAHRRLEASIARVFLNGKEISTVWCSPWEADLTSHIQNGENLLEIEVVNSLVNRMVGDASLPQTKRFTYAYPEIVTPQTSLVPSGIIDKVLIINRSK